VQGIEAPAGRLDQRGTAEQWIKEGKNAVAWTRLSCHELRDNQARLQLFALAYNPGNFLRHLALPRPVKHWSLTTLREKLIKIEAKVVPHEHACTRGGRDYNHHRKGWPMGPPARQMGNLGGRRY